MIEDQEQQAIPLYSISGDLKEKIKNNEKGSLSFLKSLFHALNQHSGIWYMLAANLIFACCTFALKLIPADMFDIMIARFLVQSSVFGIFGMYKNYDLFNTNGQPLACMLNISMSSGTSLVYLAALYFMPLSDLNTIKYTYIVWAAILSVLFLKDRFKFVNAIALCLTIIGLVLATKPHLFLNILMHISDKLSLVSMKNTTIITSNSTIVIDTSMTSSPYHYIGIGLASLSALTKAIQLIARKQLVKAKQHYSVMNFQFTGSALFVSLIYSIIRRVWRPEPYPWKWMCTAGVIIGCLHLLTNTFFAKALKRENVQLISIFGSLDIIYAVILQYIFFRQTKSWIFYIGASLIVLSAIILSVDRHITMKREKKVQTNNNEMCNER